MLHQGYKLWSWSEKERLKEQIASWELWYPLISIIKDEVLRKPINTESVIDYCFCIFYLLTSNNTDPTIVINKTMCFIFFLTEYLNRNIINNWLEEGKWNVPFARSLMNWLLSPSECWDPDSFLHECQVPCFTADVCNLVLGFSSLHFLAPFRVHVKDSVSTFCVRAHVCVCVSSKRRCVSFFFPL